MKAYDAGLLVGRFQHFHIGHESLVETGLKLCDRMMIFVGSSQESGTLRNPFSITTRISVIKEIYGDQVLVFALPDMTNENDIRPEWGRYVLDHIDRVIHKVPEVMVYGNDEARSRWFDPADIKDTTEVIVPRSRIEISATMLREMIVQDDRKQWMKWVNPRLHKMYDQLRGELLAAKPYEDKYQELIKKGA